MRSWSKTVTARLPCRRSSNCRRGSAVGTCRYLLSTSSRSSRVQAMTRSQIWPEHLPTPATKHKRAGVGCRARRIRRRRELHRLRMSTQLPLLGPRACGPRSQPLTPSGNGSCRTARPFPGRPAHPVPARRDPGVASFGVDRLGRARTVVAGRDTAACINRCHRPATCCTHRNRPSSYRAEHGPRSCRERRGPCTPARARAIFAPLVRVSDGLRGSAGARLQPPHRARSCSFDRTAVPPDRTLLGAGDEIQALRASSGDSRAPNCDGWRRGQREPS